MNRKIMKNISDISMWRSLLLLLVTMSCQVYSYGQLNNSGNPINTEALFKNQMVNTPATAALKQNIVYPINHSTGLPEIKIPLYEIKSGDITLPIYLTYHASGIKLSDAAGWVGLGWNLVAEPMITRTIQGVIDDPKTMTCEFDKDAFRTQSYIKSLALNSKEEPDEYYYRLPTKQGMFMYAMEAVDKSRKFLPIPYENIRINWTGKYFEITDDDGTVYKFNGGNELGDSNSHLIGWKASSIVASNKKDSISFMYNSQMNQYFTEIPNNYIVVRDAFSWKQNLFTDRRNGPLEIKYLPDEWMQDPIIASRVNNTTSYYQFTDSGEIVSDGTIPDRSVRDMDIYTTSQPLSEIRSAQGFVIFTQDIKYPRLQKITIYDFKGDLLREILFNYKNSGYNITNRYFLESLVITDRNGVPQETYIFGYCKPEYLPISDTRAIDYWGYFNGVFRKADETLVPWQTIDVTRGCFTLEGVYFTKNTTLSIGSKLSREVDEKYMEYGTLNSITYPTSSKDEFSYEAHRYKNEEGEIKLAGGLRIKQIRTITREGKTQVRTFKYGVNEDGCGTPAITEPLDYCRLLQGMYIGDPLTIWFMNGRVFYEPDWDRYITARHRTFFSNPTRTMTFDGGSSVMYQHVTEYNGTPEKNSGKTTYEYQIKKTLPIPEDMNTMKCNKYDGWQYNHLQCKTIYCNDNGKYMPLEETECFYSTISKNFGKILVGEAAPRYVIREAASGYIPYEIKYDYDYRRTEITVGAKYLIRSNHKVYTNDSPVRTVTEYEYSDPDTTYPTRIAETGSEGDKYITNLTYPQSYGNTYPYAEMVERNILNPVVKKEHTRKGYYLGIETPYSVPFVNVYKPKSAVICRSVSDIGDTRFTYIYNDYGRKCQETKDNKGNVVYLYGYNNQHVIAYIENATYEQVVTKLGGKEAVNKNASDQSPSMYEIDELRQSMPSARVTSYTYNQLSVASITDPFGLTTYYEYDDLGRLVKTYILNDKRQELIERNEYHYANQ